MKIGGVLKGWNGVAVKSKSSVSTFSENSFFRVFAKRPANAVRNILFSRKTKINNGISFRILKHLHLDSSENQYAWSRCVEIFRTRPELRNYNDSTLITA